MSSKDKKPKSKSKDKSKEPSRKETEKSVKSIKSSKSSKSNKSSKSKSEKTPKKGSSKQEDKSRSPSPPPQKDLSQIIQDEQKNFTNTLGSKLSPRENNNHYSHSPGYNQEINSNSHSNGEKCDGCYEPNAEVYCKECEKSYCPQCESQIHLVPVNRTHQRIPLNQMSHLKRLCYHHNTPLKYYCESCDETICHECQVIGPHNSKLHRISNLLDTYKKKFQGINEIVQGILLRKSEILSGHLYRIDNKIEEIQLKSKGIQRDIKKVYENMLEHLNCEQGKKTTILNYESSSIQKELVQIDEVINYINDSSDNVDLIGFLLRYKQYSSLIDNLVSKPCELQLDGDITDLPNDINGQLYQSDSYEKMKKIIKIKDDIIWEILQENNGEEKSERKQKMIGSGYGKVSNATISSSLKANDVLAKELAKKVHKNNINVYQILSDCDLEGSHYINQKELIYAFNKINFPIKENEVEGILKAFNISNPEQISIKDISYNIARYDI